jgi:glycine cleavage system aminomethyltransferase T
MTSPIATPATTDSTTLYFGPWYRRSPFFEKTLAEIRAQGVSRKLVGIEVAGAALPFELSRKCDALSGGKIVGTVTDLIWSPRLEKNIGYVWVPIALADPGNTLEIVAPDGGTWPARTAAIPFLDPNKDVPKA